MNRDIHFETIADIPRSSWHETYMTIACVYCTRSPDPMTKHGCVVISPENTPVGLGYNGFPRGGKDDSIYPLTRPDKLRYISHSELAALLNRSLNTQGGTVYVTGKPCSTCMIAMIQAGIKKVIYGNIGSHCVDDEDWHDTLLMADNCGIELISYSDEENSPYNILETTKEYLRLKGWL